MVWAGRPCDGVVCAGDSPAGAAVEAGPGFSVASLKVGDWFDCRDRSGKWCPAVAENVTPMDIKVCFKVWTAAA